MSLESENNIVSLEREWYQQKITAAENAVYKNQEAYDTQLLTLSSGFLAISLAFLKDIVKPNPAVHLWMIYTSFILLGACITTVLISFQINNVGEIKLRAYYIQESKPKAERASNSKGPLKYPSTFATVGQALSITSGILFLFGVIGAISFAITNLMANQIKPSQATQSMLSKHMPAFTQASFTPQTLCFVRLPQTKIY